MLEKHGDLEDARAIYHQALESSDTVYAPIAADNLGMTLKEQGDLEGAKAAYQQAIASGHSELSPLATNNLERLLRSNPPPATL